MVLLNTARGVLMLVTTMIVCKIPSAFSTTCDGVVVRFKVHVEVRKLSISSVYERKVITTSSESFVKQVRQVNRGGSFGLMIRGLGFNIGKTFERMTKDEFRECNYRHSEKTREIHYQAHKWQLFRVTTLTIEINGYVAKVRDETYFHTLPDSATWETTDSDYEAEEYIRYTFSKRADEGKGEIVYPSTYKEEQCVPQSKIFYDCI